MEVFRLREILPQQRRTDHLAINFHQTSVGLVSEEDLAQAGHNTGIEKPGQYSEKNRHFQSGHELLKHLLFFLSGQVQPNQQLIENPDTRKANNNSSQACFQFP